MQDMGSPDILNRKGPVIAVHKDWLLSRKKRSKASRRQSGSTPSIPPSQEPTPPARASQRFAFVNATKPDRSRDADVRKLVRSHVRQDHASKAFRSKINMEQVRIVDISVRPQSPSSCTATPSSELVKIPENIGLLTSLCSSIYPIKMHPRTHMLLEHYLRHTTTSRIHSVQEHIQLRPHAWFQFAVTDPAMLHAILYAGALYIALQKGERESRDTIYHQSQVVLMINQRLKDTSHVADATIGAITCLALGAVCSLK